MQKKLSKNVLGPRYNHPTSFRNNKSLDQNLFGTKKDRPDEEEPIQKKKISKVHSLIKQAQNSLAIPFPNVNYLMLKTYQQMSQLQKSQLNSRFRDYLNSKLNQLPLMLQEITPKEQEIKQQEESDNGQTVDIDYWIKPPADEIQRQLVGYSNKYFEDCKQLKQIYLKLIQNTSFINY